MGLYIKGMELPKGSYRTVEIGFDADWHPMAIGDDGNVYDVISVPPHGKLIDANALCKTLRSLAENEYTPEVFANWIENHIDTFIPAEEDHDA